MVTEAPRRLLGRDPVIAPGTVADLVLLPSESDAMAVAEIARPLWGMKAGRLSFERPAERLFPPGQ